VLVVVLTTVMVVVSDSNHGRRKATSSRMIHHLRESEDAVVPVIVAQQQRFLTLDQQREGDAARGGGDKHVTSYAQRHQNHYSTGSSSSSSNSGSVGYRYYNYDDDAVPSVRRRYHRNSEFYTDLSDVWLCLLTALGWAVWMISSFVSSKKCARGGMLSTEAMDERFYQQKDNVLLVRGHVREVSRTDNEGGFPTYTAVIDYIIESEQTHETIQIRKHFETQQALEQGFANIELLVLPEEPTHSILKDDFDRQIQEEKQVKLLEQERQNRRKNMSYDTADDRDPLEDILAGRYCNQKCKRLSTGVAAVLVVASLGGTVQVICLMDPALRWQGWLSFCVIVTLLLPAALLMNKCMMACTRWQEQPEKQGYIVQSYTTTGTVVTSGNNNNISKTPNGSNDGSISLIQACMPPSCGGLMDDICDQTVTDGSSRNPTTAARFPYAEVASYVVPEMSGCYFVHYPTEKNSRSHKHHRSSHLPPEQTTVLHRPVSTIHEVPTPNDDISSTSTISSISDEDPVEISTDLWHANSSI
jgi:hypothetical protein